MQRRALAILTSKFLTLTLIASTASAANLDVRGSSTIFPVVKEAAKPFAQKTKHILQVEGGGSGFGIKFAEEGKGLGMASRALKAEEKATGIVATPIGFDGLAVVVHPDNPLKNISKADLAKIFSGETSDWSKAGGPAGKIVLLGPNKDHGTYEAFIDIMKLKDKLAGSFKGFQSHRETMFNVDKDKNAIGWVPLGHYQTYVSEEKKFKIRAVSVDGVEPTVETTKSSKYPLVRELNLLTKGPATGVAKEFIDFMLSAEGQQMVTKFDFVAAK